MAKLDDIDAIFEETEAIKHPKKAHKRRSNSKTITVRSTLDIALDDYKEAKRIQKKNIKVARLLIKQAKNTYRLVKLQEA